MRTRLIGDVGLGLGAAYAATKIMDRTTTWLMNQQPEDATKREREVQPEQASTVAAKKLATVRGESLDDKAAQKRASLIHKGLGLSGGPVATILTRNGDNSLTAGLKTGIGMWALVDEGLNPVMGFSKPAPDFPLATHLRGLVGHLVYGASLGALLAVGRQLPPFRA